MKKLLLFITLFYLFQTNAQQNLVLNPSFEDVSGNLNCSFYGGQTIPITNWSSGSQGTTDAYSTSVAISCQMHPLNPQTANQAPRTGNNYMAFTNGLALTSNYREYIRGRLSQPLVVGTMYNIEFYVCLTSYANAGMNNIGLVFINNSVPIYPIITPIPLQPHVNYSGSPIMDRDNWTLLSFQYTATTPNLDSFLIGNFFDSPDTDFQIIGSGSYAEAYYLVDDVSITEAVLVFEIEELICQGDNLVLPQTSIDGISGTWSPAPNNQETTNYTFTPNNPIYPTYEITVVVKPIITPEFDEIGPFCDVFADITALPLVSNNGIEGTWSPVFNPNQTTTYTFVPADTKCVETITKTIIIDKTPTFNSVEPFCEIDLNFSLPTVSTNGISGTWSPEFDSYNSQTYTFTRDSGDCIQQVTLDVVVYPQLKFELFRYCKDDEYFVEVIASNFSVSEISSFQWLINNISISETGSKIKLSEYSNLLQEVNTIEIIFTDSNDCLHTKEIQVLGKIFCNIQKGISPNRDGLNEFLDLESFGGVDLKIFNRYGNIVYENSNYKNEWHGQSKSGKVLPNGTYFYQIQTNIGEQFTGYIQVTY